MLVLKNVRKNFWDLKAVDNISFEIKDGEIVSLIGSNGAGKTTLVNLISGYLKPDSGTIFFEDRISPRRRLIRASTWGSVGVFRLSTSLKTSRSWTMSAPPFFPSTALSAAGCCRPDGTKRSPKKPWPS